MDNLKTIWTQQLKFQLGALIDLVTYALFWFGLINFVFIGLTAYNTTLKEAIQTVLPGFNILWFLVSLIVVAIIIMIAERFVLYPARQHFRNKWEYSHESPIRQDLSQVLRNQEDIKEVKRNLELVLKNQVKILKELNIEEENQNGSTIQRRPRQPKSRLLP